METAQSKTEFLVNAQAAISALANDIDLAVRMVAAWDARQLGAGKVNEIKEVDVLNQTLQGGPADYEALIEQVREVVTAINANDALSVLVAMVRR